MQSRNKTQRKRGPSTPAPEMEAGPFESGKAVSATEHSLDSIFAAESESTFHQTWQRLDRGARLDRLRKFVTSFPDVSPAERASLLTAVLGAFELKQLNTKIAVEYDPTKAQVVSIRGLRERVATSGLKTFRIEPVSATTTRGTLKSKAKEPKVQEQKVAALTPTQ
jgi:hypothetical protein